MKTHLTFFAMALVLALSSCGTATSLTQNDQQYRDAVYYRKPSLSKTDRSIASARTEGLVAKTQGSDIYLKRGQTDTLFIPDGKFASIRFDRRDSTTTVNLFDYNTTYNSWNYNWPYGYAWGNPYWYGPHFGIGFSFWHGPWGPWYPGAYWAWADPFWYPYYFDPFYCDPFYWDPFYYHYAWNHHWHYWDYAPIPPHGGGHYYPVNAGRWGARNGVGASPRTSVIGTMAGAGSRLSTASASRSMASAGRGTSSARSAGVTRSAGNGGTIVTGRTHGTTTTTRTGGAVRSTMVERSASNVSRSVGSNVSRSSGTGTSRSTATTSNYREHGTSVSSGNVRTSSSSSSYGRSSSYGSSSRSGYSSGSSYSGGGRSYSGGSSYSGGGSSYSGGGRSGGYSGGGSSSGGRR